MKGVHSTKGGKFRGGLLLTTVTALGISWSWLQVSAPGSAPFTTESHELSLHKASTRGPTPNEQGEARDSVPANKVAEKRVIEDTQRPHPITKMHEAMAERRELIGALVSALEGKHYDRARSLLAEADELHRASSSPPPGLDDESASFDATVRGYRLILECLSARGVGNTQEVSIELKEASKRYLDEQRLSPRREVRRVCLEGRPFARRA
jgi:hypothetical protein